MKPTPAMVPAPVTAAQPIGGWILPRLTLVSSQAAATVPTGFPATYPSRIPSVTGEL